MAGGNDGVQWMHGHFVLVKNTLYGLIAENNSLTIKLWMRIARPFATAARFFFHVCRQAFLCAFRLNLTSPVRTENTMCNDFAYTRLASVAAAIAEPARVRMLCCLMDGHARANTELAVVAEVSPSTAVYISPDSRSSNWCMCWHKASIATTAWPALK